jgi:hypothetical protein
MAALDRARLCGGWRHSHEEDAVGTEVYRREGYAFPRSRGRRAFTLEADGTLRESGPGPSDRPASARAGTWRIDGPNLVLAPARGAARARRVIALDDDRLVLAR